MTARLGLGNETILGAVVLATLMLSLRSGVGAVTGYLLAGALLGGWSYVYAFSMCAGQPVVWAQLARRAVGGAAAAPVIAVAGLVAGPVVWVMAAAGVAGWVLLVTPHGTVSIPVRLRRGIDEQLRAMCFLRGPLAPRGTGSPPLMGACPRQARVRAGAPGSLVGKS